MAKNNKTRFFYVLYSDKTWVFDQSERAYYPIYVINIFISYLYYKYIYNIDRIVRALYIYINIYIYIFISYLYYKYIYNIDRIVRAL